MSNTTGNIQLEELPNWAINWGLYAIIAFLMSMLLLASFINYPLKIDSEVIITSNYPLLTIKAKSSGYVTVLYPNHKKVNQGQVLGVISNSSNYDQVFSLKQEINSNKDWNSKLKKICTLNFDSLGSIQNNYEQLIQNYKDYRRNITYDTNEDEINKISQSLNFQLKILKNLKELFLISEHELSLKKKNCKMNFSLYTDSVISSLDYDKSLLDMLFKEKEHVSVKREILKTESQISSITENIKTLEKKGSIDSLILIENLMKNLSILKNKISEWEDTYVLKAQGSGILEYYNIRNNNEYISINESVFTIRPDDKNVIGIVYLPMKNRGKVKLGQKVNIKLASYPFEEYGILYGSIESISKVPANDSYQVQINLPKGLKTSANYRLKFIPNMKGQAEVILERSSLLKRFFYQTIRALNK